EGDGAGGGTHAPTSIFGSEVEFKTLKELIGEVSEMLWLVRGVQMVPADPRGAAWVALARTLMSENSQKRVVTLDLGDSDFRTSPSLILDVFSRTYLTESAAGPRDVEYAAS